MSAVKKLLSFIILLTSFLLLLSCGGSDNSGDDLSLAQQRMAQAYLSEIITIMRNNALTRNEVNWSNLESEVSQLAANVGAIKDTYPAITRALELINTNHSFLNSPSGALITYPSTIRCEQNLALDTPEEPGIGYVRVDAVMSRDAAEAKQIATTIQQEIAKQDSQGVTAWIVDLRNNQGGNMWPMIAGLGPLFEGTTLGYFIDADENSTWWGYNNGSSLLGGSPVVTVDKPYSLITPLPKIAVLTSKRTASSGEATVIAFKKQFNVQFFGTDSCGLSTANTNFTLSDNSALFLTTAVIADREQQKYGVRIPVDEATSSEHTLASAIAWLQN